MLELQRWVRTILQRRRWRYVLAGSANTFVGLSAYPVLWFTLHPFGTGYILILTLSQIVSVSFAFFTTKLYVFRTRGNHLTEACKFGSFHLLYFIGNIGALRLLVEVFHVAPIIAQTGISSASLICGYVWHRCITFSPNIVKNTSMNDYE